MRYGGRDARAPDSYLDLDSIELALEKGLELHNKYQKGELPKIERPKASSRAKFRRWWSGRLLRISASNAI